MLSTPSENKETSSYKSFSKNQLQDYQEVETWLKTIGKSSVNLYLNALKKFCEFSGKNPHELIIIRDKETRNSTPNNRTGLRDLVLDFRVYLEKEGYAPKTINSLDGAVRSFFTAVLGKVGMVNVKNYRDGIVTRRKDLVPTLEELKRMLDVSNFEEKFRIIFIAQTGMRVSDALALKIGDIQRELDLGKVPLAIAYVPKKDREMIGERITFLGCDGVEILKRYLEWRKRNGESMTEESPLFVGRTRRGLKPIIPHRFNETIKRAARKAGLNGDGKYGIMRVHCLRKFFITQLTNHGVEDKIVNFLTCHKISEVDRVYWFRRVEELRKIYAQRQQYLNPVNGNKPAFDLKKFDGIIAKIKYLESKIDNIVEREDMKKLIKEIVTQEIKMGVPQVKFKSIIVSTDQEIIALTEQGYDCQSIGENKWLMKRNLNIPFKGS